MVYAQLLTMQFADSVANNHPQSIHLSRLWSIIKRRYREQLVRMKAKTGKNPPKRAKCAQFPLFGFRGGQWCLGSWFDFYGG